jgi:hypothetical protein
MGIDFAKLRSKAHIEATLTALSGLPVYDGPCHETDCTCAFRVAARVRTKGKWRPVCSKCGSLRQGTGT